MAGPAWQQAPLAPTGQAELTNPKPSWEMAPQAPSWRKPASDDLPSLYGNALVGGALGMVGLPGDIVSGVEWARGKIGEKTGQPPPPNVVPWKPPTTRQVNEWAGYTPMQANTPTGHVVQGMGSFAAPAIGALLTGGTTALPWALARNTASGAASGGAGDIAAMLLGESGRPVGQVAGAVLGGFGSAKVGGTAARAVTRVSAPAKADLRENSQALFKAGNDAGVFVRSDVIDGIYKDVVQAGWDKGLRENRPGTQQAIAAAKALADEVDRIGKNGQASLQDLQTMKEILRDAVPEGSAAAGAMIARLGDRIDALTAGDVVSGVDPKTALNYISQANALWKQKSKAETIGKIISDAQLLQTADKPGAYPAALQAGFRRLARDDNFAKYWTPDEQYAIVTAAKGGGIGPQLLRLTGRTMGASSNLPFLAAPGTAVRGLGNLATTQAARYADALARTGPNTNPFTMMLPVPRTTSDLAAALIGGTTPFRGAVP